MRKLAIAGIALAVVLAAALWLMIPRAAPGLVLYSAVDYGPGVARAFTKQTGIPVKVVELSTGALLARVFAEGRHPNWSLVWFDGDQAAVALDHAGLLAPDTLPGLPWTTLGHSILPADGSYTPTGVTLAGVFIYRPKDLARPPIGWTGLLSPAMKDRFGMDNPTISGPTYPLFAGLLAQSGGWPEGKAFVLALKKNGLHIYPKNTNTLAALRAGDIELAVTQSSAAWNVATKYPGFKVRVPKPAFLLPSVIAAAKSLDSKTLAEARRFIRFTMSPAVQKLRLTKGGPDSFYWPITTNAPPPRKALPPLASLTLKTLNPATWGVREAAINGWIDKAVLMR